MGDRTAVDAVRSALADPRTVVRLLGLAAGAKPQHRGVIVRCPAHEDRTPSCSVRVGDDGTIAVKCHACGFSSDVLGLVAQVERLHLVREFPEVLRRAGALAGVNLDRQAVARAPRPPPPPPRPRAFPPVDEVRDLWNACAPCEADLDVATWLRSRGIDVANVDRFSLARALPPALDVPRWAAYRGDAAEALPWSALGYRAIVPMYDAAGELRSVRARYVGPSVAGQPKALPPSGHATKGLVMLNPLAVMLFQVAAWRSRGSEDALAHGGDGWPAWSERRVLVCEGEPDFLSWAARSSAPSSLAILGIGGSGQWTETLAERIPDGGVALLRTDEDNAGDAYAVEIAATLRGRCAVRESNPDARAVRRATERRRKAERTRPQVQNAGAR